MLKHIDEFLLSFRSSFSRSRTWMWFVVLVIGIAARQENDGICSVMRILDLPEQACDSLYRFFRSKACSLERLQNAWYSLLLRFIPYRINGRICFLADGYKHYKEGRRMPAVKRIRDSSASQSKNPVINGHFFGAVALAVSIRDKVQALMVSMRIHDGNETIETWKGTFRQSHIMQMYLDTVRAARALGQKAYGIYDRFFLNRDVLFQWMKDREDDPLLHLVYRCKGNVTAWDFPERNRPAARGRKPLTGKKHSLKKLVLCESGKLLSGDTEQEKILFFREAKLVLYGTEKQVCYASRIFLWGQGLYIPLQFVFSRVDDSWLILATTDLDADPLDMIRAYSIRFRIEHGFRELNQIFGVWKYRFHSHSTPRYNPYFDQLKALYQAVTSSFEQEKIIESLEAIERYVFVCLVSYGLVRFLCMKMESRKAGLRFPFSRKKDRERVISVQVIQETLRRKLPFWVMAPSGSETINVLREAMEADRRTLTETVNT